VWYNVAMIYVCSDIHGQYNLFVKLLKAVKFGKDDVMYVGGDVVDKGPDGIRLLQLVKNTPNIHVIMGNHEYQFVKYYWALMSKSPSNFDEVLAKLQGYFDGDGHLLDWQTVDYLEGLPFFVETTNFVLVHSGVPVDANNNVIAPQYALPEQLLYDRQFKDPSVLPNTPKCILYGHTPTSYLCNKPKILRYQRPNTTGDSIGDYYKIHLDVGAWYEGTMACLCIDTMQEFYVTND